MRFARAFPCSTIRKLRCNGVRTCSYVAAAVEGAPLVGRAKPEATDTLNSDSTRRLTFDMRRRPKRAQRALGCRLDGVVRRLCS